VAGSNITNLRQLVMNELKQEIKTNQDLQDLMRKRLWGSDKLIETYIVNLTDYTDLTNLPNFFNQSGESVKSDEFDFVCLCTRCREIRNRKRSEKSSEEVGRDDVLLVIRKYQSSVGDEYFISFETAEGYLIGFTRLLLPKDFADWD
jgi:hypothetical protein